MHFVFFFEALDLIKVRKKLLKSKIKKEKCERSQLWSMDWCGERPFGHRASHHLF